MSNLDPCIFILSFVFYDTIKCKTICMTLSLVILEFIIKKRQCVVL